MPRYEYFCVANQQAVEVQHPMDRSLRNWGELCEWAGMERGDVPAEAPVVKRISGGYVMTGSSRRSEPDSASSCCGGGCALH